MTKGVEVPAWLQAQCCKAWIEQLSSDGTVDGCHAGAVEEVVRALASSGRELSVQYWVANDVIRRAEASGWPMFEVVCKMLDPCVEESHEHLHATC